MTLKRLAVFVLLNSVAVPALAADCSVNVFNAYNTAKLRGWLFECFKQPTIGGGFVPYPAPWSSIGCAFTTPPVVAPSSLGTGRLFKRANGAPPNLKNGWRVLSYEVSGGQWVVPYAADGARVTFVAKSLQPNRTYNYYVSKLTLRRDGGSCAKAIDEAF